MMQQSLSALAELRPSIERATIYHLGTIVLTYAPMSAEALEADEDTQVFHATGSELDRLLEILASLERGALQNKAIDARWGFVFESASGERLAAIYLDRFGTAISDGGATCASLTNAEHAMETLRGAYGPDGVIA
jgi:hypothetical protein